jgi:hypothetical protein
LNPAAAPRPSPTVVRLGHHRHEPQLFYTTCKTSSRTFLAATSSVTTMDFMFYTCAPRTARALAPKSWVGPHSPHTASPLSPRPGRQKRVAARANDRRQSSGHCRKRRRSDGGDAARSTAGHPHPRLGGDDRREQALCTALSIANTRPKASPEALARTRCARHTPIR